MTNKYKIRQLISFDERCPMMCKHCYTYELEEKMKKRSHVELVQSLKNKEFDIIYVSQSCENFFDEDAGVALCSDLYHTYHKDLFVITRNFLCDKTIEKLAALNRYMNEHGNQLFLSVSVCADESYGLTENVNLCPSPRLRLVNLERAFKQNIKTLLIVRPVFPDHVIPVVECLNLIESAQSYVCAVISSGLIVTDHILDKLGLDKGALSYHSDGDSEYLDNLPREAALYVDVDAELEEIRTFCISKNMLFFRHSMPALNALAAEA